MILYVFLSVESLHVAASQVSEADRPLEETTEKLSVKHRFNTNEILECLPHGK